MFFERQEIKIAGKEFLGCNRGMKKKKNEWDMPWHIIAKVHFEEDKIKMLITFKTGNQLSSIAPDKESYEEMKKNMIERVGHENVRVT